MKLNWLWTLVFSVWAWSGHSMKYRPWLPAIHRHQSIHWGRSWKPEYISCISSRPRSNLRGDKPCCSKWKYLPCSPPCAGVCSSSTGHCEGWKIRRQGHPPSPRGLPAGCRQWRRPGLPRWHRSANLEVCWGWSYRTRCRWRGHTSTQPWSRHCWCTLRTRGSFHWWRSWHDSSGAHPWELSSATGWRRAHSIPQRPERHQNFALRWKTRGHWRC